MACPYVKTYSIRTPTIHYTQPCQCITANGAVEQRLTQHQPLDCFPKPKPPAAKAKAKAKAAAEQDEEGQAVEGADEGHVDESAAAEGDHATSSAPPSVPPKRVSRRTGLAPPEPHPKAAKAKAPPAKGKGGRGGLRALQNLLA